MATTVVELKHGIVVNGATHKRIKLKTLTVGESLASVDAAEKAIMTPTGYHLLCSPAHLQFQNILRMANFADEPDIVMTENIMRTLSGDDYDLLAEAAQQLDNAETRAVEMINAGR